MAQKEILSLEFGSLKTAIHETRIDDSDLADGQNWISTDGTLRLDQRYIQFWSQQTDGLDAYGSGYGKYVGDDAYTEQYAYVIEDPNTGNAQLVQYDLTDNELGAKILCTNYPRVQWFFQQFQDYMYLTSIAGIRRYQMVENPTGMCDNLEQPTTPPTQPSAIATLPEWTQVEWDSSSITASGSASSSYNSTTNVWTINYSGQATRTVQIDFATASKPDLSYHDFLSHFLIKTAGVTMPSVFMIQDSSTTQLLDWWNEVNGNGFRLYNRLHNVARTGRNSVVSLVYTFDTPTGNSSIQIYAPYYAFVWLTIDTNSNANPNEHPPFNDLIYVYTRYDSTTGFESDVSPEVKKTPNQQNFFGDWFTVRGQHDAEGGNADKWRYYRAVMVGGVKKYFRLATGDASYSFTQLDKLPLDEIEALDEYSPNQLPSDGFTAITAWQNRLVVAAGSIVYISRFNQPLEFEAITGPTDPYDEGQGLTFYPDDRRAEEVLTLIGQDDLYMVTDFSVRCLIGNSPFNWRNIKLGDSEGACGQRAACAYKKGILVLTPSGRLLYHHSSLNDPIEVSEDLRARIGNDGIKEFATSDAIVTVRPDGSIEVRSGTQYLVLGVDGKWRRGTFTHGSHSALYVSGLPIRWLGTNGKIYEGGSDDYVSDGGTTGTNGFPATWWVKSKKFRKPRMRVQSVFWGESSESAYDDEMRYPALDVITHRGENSITKRRGKRNARVPVDSASEGLQFKISGDKDTVVEECRITLSPLAKAEQT